MRKRNFTLTELLVVISVFLILASLLSPSLSKMLRSAHETVCANSTRDLLIVTHTYADDADGYFMDLAKLPNSAAIQSSPYWTFGYWRNLLTTDYALSREHFYSPTNEKWNSDSFYYYSGGSQMVMGRMYFGAKGRYSTLNSATPVAKRGTPTFAIRNTDMPSQRALWTDLNRRWDGYFITPGDEERRHGSNHLYAPNYDWPSLTHNGMFDGSLETNDSLSIQLQMTVGGIELFW